MWKTCVTLALLICVQVCAHGPLYPRVVEGANAQKKAWPWMVSLHNPTCHFCGGSLISSQWVLSAAHCFVSDDDNTIMDKTSIRVYLGKMTQREKNKKEKMLKVQGIHIHNLYNATTVINDIALLHLSSPVKFNNYIHPLCLVAYGSDFPPRTSSRIIGWGKIADEVNLPYPGTLQEAEIFVVDHTDCQNQLMLYINQLIQNNPGTQLPSQVNENMTCAGVPGGGRKDAHHGDSGGPMMSQHCSKWVQSGITSWGFLTSPFQGETLGVYTRVSQYQQWITDIIRPYSSKDLPQFVNVNDQCQPDTGTQGGKWKWCCCFRG